MKKKSTAATVNAYSPIGEKVKSEVIGQDASIDQIVPYVDIYEAGLAPEGRPVGVFLLLGPSGCGKTRSVEALAQAIHGSEKNVLRVDCGEYQLDHEIAKLIGCFTPGTMVFMGDGTQKPIECIRIGDSVVTKHGTVRRVVDTYEYQQNGEMVRLRALGSDALLSCTPDHKIRALQNSAKADRFSWVFAGNLQCGDIVICPYSTDPFACRYAPITAIERFHYAGPVYDISVDKEPSYVANGITVSNSPPGYLGHRETTPIITQNRLNAVSSNQSALSIVLFDEIEKAAPSLVRLLLGVLDKAVLKLGDNTTVNFNSSLIFMTSNLGARKMADAMAQRFGFSGSRDISAEQIAKIGVAAAKKRFSPEFVNRIDAIIPYSALTAESFDKILSIQMDEVQRLVDRRYADETFLVCLTTEARQFITELGFSKEYGARELKRVIHTHVLVPLAKAVLADEIKPGDAVRFHREGNGLRIAAKGRAA